jgi:beta-ureidopropionase / N-carbamoyl-L-amino-acid hydrolase
LPTAPHSLDAERLWADVMALAAITDPHRPYTRRSFSPLFLEARAWLARQFAAAGLAVRIDAAGNLIGRLGGKNPELGVLAIGSHSDTVPSGGRFDGVAGIATGLEVARALRDASERLDHSLEIIDFLAEEPSDYGLSCVGSRGMSGALTAQMLEMKEPGSETLREALRRVGGDPDGIGAARRADIKAFLELHIEQGSVLESQAVPVGIVTAIAGIRRIAITFEGAADHAGTTPMAMRHDALVAAANTVISVRRTAERLAGEGAGYFVATAGVLTVDPGAPNVVPAKCRMVIDIRTTVPALTERFTQAIERESAQHAAAARVARSSSLEILSDGLPVDCDVELRRALKRSAGELGLRSVELASGAGHDAAFMTRICPSAMVFVPCRDGKSHTPEEWADRDAIAAGAAVILDTVKSLDQTLPRTAPRATLDDRTGGARG